MWQHVPLLMCVSTAGMSKKAWGLAQAIVITAFIIHTKITMYLHVHTAAWKSMNGLAHSRAKAMAEIAQRTSALPVVRLIATSFL